MKVTLIDFNFDIEITCGFNNPQAINSYLKNKNMFAIHKKDKYIVFGTWSESKGFGSTFMIRYINEQPNDKLCNEAKNIISIGKKVEKLKKEKEDILHEKHYREDISERDRIVQEIIENRSKKDNLSTLYKSILQRNLFDDEF